MHIRMLRSFSVPLGPGATKTYPAGWVGEADDEHAEAAIDEGAAVESTVFSPEGDTQSGELDLSKLTRAELDALASKRGVEIASATNKAEVIALLEAA